MLNKPLAKNTTYSGILVNNWPRLSTCTTEKAIEPFYHKTVTPEGEIAGMRLWGCSEKFVYHVWGRYLKPKYAAARLRKLTQPGRRTLN